jgi:ATP:corrinoid adenosyltransferase
MKTRKLVETQNVVEATREVKKLLKRTREEIPGLALIYGRPGYGKTSFGERLAFKNGWGYYRMEKSDKAKAFLEKLHRILCKLTTGIVEETRGNAQQIFKKCLVMLQDHPETTVVIDEINLTIQSLNWDILEIIRDFVDKSYSTFILIGEEDTKDRLQKYNSHYFNRCYFFYQFKPCSVEDYKKYFNEVCEIPLADDLINHLHLTTSGEIRSAAKQIDDLEFYAKKTQAKELTLDMLLGEPSND